MKRGGVAGFLLSPGGEGGTDRYSHNQGIGGGGAWVGGATYHKEMPGYSPPSLRLSFVYENMKKKTMKKIMKYFWGAMQALTGGVPKEHRDGAVGLKLGGGMVEVVNLTDGNRAFVHDPRGGGGEGPALSGEKKLLPPAGRASYPAPPLSIDFF